MDLTAAVKKEKVLFRTVNKNKVECKFQGTDYSMKALKVHFSAPEEDVIFRITLENNSNKFNFSEREEFCISS